MGNLLQPLAFKRLDQVGGVTLGLFFPRTTPGCQTMSSLLIKKKLRILCSELYRDYLTRVPPVWCHLYTQSFSWSKSYGSSLHRHRRFPLLWPLEPTGEQWRSKEQNITGSEGCNEKKKVELGDCGLGLWFCHSGGIPVNSRQVWAE